MKDDFIYKLGVYGQMHYQHLKNTNPLVISVMRMKGTLRPYLEEIDDNANEMLSLLEKQMADKEVVTEELKAKDQMAWICAKNSIRERAREIVLSEVVYT